MKNLFTACLLFIVSIGFSQSLTLTSPSDLTPPYEVSSGTVVTVQWSYFSEEPTYMFTYDEDPGSDLNTDWQFFPNSDWTSGSGWTDNGDGTYSWDVTITEDTWIFGAFNTFSGNSYSNVIQVSVASTVVINYEDGLICETDGNESLSVEGVYTSYQWYQDEVLIVGATSSSYEATEAGSYYVLADDVQSNTLDIENIMVSFLGSVSVDGTEITLTADSGMDSYQWYSGPDEANMTAITGATDAEYVASITTDLVFYHVVVNLDGCEVTSMDRPVSTAIFTPLVLSVNADTNGFNNVCSGSTIALSIDEDAENYTWFKNGNSIYNDQTYYNITSTWNEGVYYVESIPAEWPEISLQSNSADATYFSLIVPVLTGESNNSLHCAGDDISIYLSDEGYDYYWYAHEAYNYNDTDLVDGIGSIYTFTYENAIRITVVAEYQGCQASTTLNLSSYEDQSIYVSVTNYDQQYLCTDSVANIALSSFNIPNYTDYQWFKKDGDDWMEIDNEISATYAASDTGYYRLRATSINCSSAIIESNIVHIQHYQERVLNLYAYPNEMCVGDTATLNMYSTSWTNIQYLEGIIQIGSTGYELLYVPIIGAGTENSQDVYDFNHYIVKAKHQSCPNGLKITSSPVIIKPSVNPEVSVDISNITYYQMLWDSAAFYLGCVNQEVHISIEGDYDSYQWYEEPYAGIDDYVLGEPISGATSDSLLTYVDVQWITAEVSLDGCIGYTDPILLDGWAFQNPAIASYNSNQICDGDSALLHLAYPGDWIEYYWLHDLDTVPNSNNDSIWVSEPGQYIIFAYPEQCPTTVFTSGQGPDLEIFEAIILEDADDEGNGLFYAWPFQGDFTFQWYLDGEPIDGDPEFPWVVWHAGLGAGEITVEIINNGDDCTDLSEVVLWDPSVGVDELSTSDLIVYPNPTQGELTIQGLDPSKIRTVNLYNSQGKKVRAVNINSDQERIDISDLPVGIYLLHINGINGMEETIVINKQ
jgi:hypothetical protein